MLAKNNISLPDHRVNRKPCTPPSDNLLQRGYLKGIGWLPMSMLLGPANGSTMVRHVLDVCEGALPSNHTIPSLSLFPRFKSNIVIIKCYVCCKWCKQARQLYLFFRSQYVIWLRNPQKNIEASPPKQSNIATNGQTAVPFFPVVIWSRNPPNQSKLMEPSNIPTDGQMTVPFFLVVIWLTKKPAKKHGS